MRNAVHILTVFAALSTLISATPNIFAPFYEPILHNFLGIDNSTSQELRRRQGTACPSGYGNNCAGLGNAALCCADNAVCSADYAGNVACCPIGAACTGSIASTSTTTLAGSATTTTGVGGVGGVITSSASTASSTDSFLLASTATSSSASTETTASGGGVIISQTGGGSSNLATVSNPYFPIAIVPATYANADACSNAYSSCQSDISSCTAVLMGNNVAGGNGGITIDAPGGGTTVLAATTSYPSATASSICASLSTRACGTFSVQQCSIFGSGTASTSSQSGAAPAQRARPVVYVIMVAMVMVAG